MATGRYTNIEGQVVAEKRGGGRTALVPDGVGSTIAVIDSSGALAASLAYRPYGEVQASTGAPLTRLKFAGVGGGYGSTGRVYLRARHYEPKLGRWQTPDPSHRPPDGAFTYVSNNPGTYGDPTGLQRQRGASLTETCDRVEGYLRSRTTNPCKCPNGVYPDPNLMICLFWQESNLGSTGKLPGNFGTLNDPALRQLSLWGCNPKRYRRNPAPGETDLARATPEEMAQLAAFYLGCVGLGPRYGPDYPTSGALVRRIRCCANCMENLLVRIKESDPCRYCARAIHD